MARWIALLLSPIFAFAAVGQDAAQENVAAATDGWPGVWFSDDFSGAKIDTNPPAPWWWWETHNRMEMEQRDGLLHMRSPEGTHGWGEVRARVEPSSYDDFSVHVIAHFAHPASSLGATGEVSAAVRLRINDQALGYGLWFDLATVPQTVSFRRIDTGAVINDASATLTLPTDAPVYISAECQGPRLAARIGTGPGLADLAELAVNDATYNAGTVWLSSRFVRDIRWDEFHIGPPGWSPWGR